MLRFPHLLTLLLVFLVSCGGPSEPPPPPTPTPTPAETAAAIGRATQAATSFHFVISLTGAPVAADQSGLFTLNGIEGDFVRPNGLLAALQVGGALGVTEVRTVSFEGKQYATNPLTRTWTCLAAGESFDPAVLFDPTIGVETILQQGLSEVSLVGPATINGAEALHLRATVDGTALAAISSNLLGAGPVSLDLYADPASLQAVRLVLVDTTTDPATPSTWTVDFSEYGKTVDLRAPIECP